MSQTGNVPTYIPAPAASRTGPFLYLAGGLAYGQAAVPYFSISMTVQQLVSQVKLPDEVPFNMDQPVDIEELFQRERDEDRSKQSIARYLKNPNDLKFFNSITVALFPLRINPTTNKVELATNYDEDSYFGDKPPGLGGEDVGVGQVSIYRHPMDKSQGFISWDDARTLPVVLDGQHRLASLKHVLSPGQIFQGKHELEQSRLSVLLLVLDKRAGYDDPQGRSVMAACRTVFTDLNKNAKSVSRARQYLLDEGDVRASSLRAVLAQSVSTKPMEPILQRAKQDKRLPLALIDWRGEVAKFDKGPYISTILALYPVVESIIGIKVPAEDDYDEMRGYVNRITSRLLDASEAAEIRTELLNRIKIAEPKEVPFAFKRDEVLALASGFRNTFGARIVRTLTEFEPYDRLISAMSKAGYYDSPVEAWFSLDAAGRDALLNELDIADPSEEVSKIATAIKGSTESGRFDLSFQVVFQRALLSAGDLFVTFGDAIAADSSLVFVSEADVIDHFIDRANRRLAPGLSLGTDAKKASPFIGAGIRSDGTIDFRKTRVAGIAGFMIYTLLAPDEIFDPSTNAKQRDAQARRWLRDRWSLITRGPKSGMEKLYSSQGAAWRRGLLDVVSAREVDEQEVEAEMLELAVTQFRGLTAAIKKVGAN